MFIATFLCDVPKHRHLQPKRLCFPRWFSGWKWTPCVCVRVNVCDCVCAPPTLTHSAPWKPQFSVWCWSLQDPLPARGERDAPGASTRKRTVRKMTVERIFDELGHFKRYQKRVCSSPDSISWHICFLLWMSSGYVCGIIRSRLGSFWNQKLFLLHVTYAFLKTNTKNPKRAHPVYVS